MAHIRIIWLASAIATAWLCFLGRETFAKEEVLAQEALDSPFELNKNPLDKTELELLAQRGYRFDSQGRLFPSDSQEPVGQEELPFILEEIKSHHRLKALMELDLILSRNNYSKSLPKQDLDAVRKIGRENWGLLSKKSKRELLRFLPEQELETMHFSPKQIANISHIPDPPKAQSPSSLGEVSPKADPPKSTETPAKPAKLVGSKMLESFQAAPAPQQISNSGTTQEEAAAEAALAALKTAEQARQKALEALKAAERAKQEKFLAALPAHLTSPSIPVTRDIVPLPAPWKTKVSEPIVALPAPWKSSAQSPIPQQAPKMAQDAPTQQTQENVPVPAPEKPSRPPSVNITYPEFDAASFQSFLNAAPYGRDIKPILEVLAKHARDPERRIALGLLQRLIPQILIDSQKIANKSRAAIFRLPGDPALPGHFVIVLNDGPVLAQRRKMLVQSQAYFLSDSGEFYRERGLSLPTLQAFSRESPSQREEESPWGRVRFYEDGSSRLRYSTEQLAGTLLKQLMNLDAALRGWEDDVVHTELRAWSAQLRFYQLWAQNTGQQPRLDKELEARYKEWSSRPEDYVDFLIQALATAREAALPQATLSAQALYDMQRRSEISLLADTGLFGEETRRILELIPATAVDQPLVGEIQALEAYPEVEAAWLSQERASREKP